MGLNYFFYFYFLFKKKTSLSSKIIALWCLDDYLKIIFNVGSFSNTFFMNALSSSSADLLNSPWTIIWSDFSIRPKIRQTSLWHSSCKNFINSSSVYPVSSEISQGKIVFVISMIVRPCPLSMNKYELFFLCVIWFYVL